MAQNIGGARMPTPAARWGRASLRAPATQARNVGPGKNSPFPSLIGESDGSDGVLDPLRKGKSISSPFYLIICSPFIHSPLSF